MHLGRIESDEITTAACLNWLFFFARPVKLTAVNDKMAEYTNTPGTASLNAALMHTLQRHRDILQVCFLTSAHLFELDVHWNDPFGELNVWDYRMKCTLDLFFILGLHAWIPQNQRQLPGHPGKRRPAGVRQERHWVSGWWWNESTLSVRGFSAVVSLVEESLNVRGLNPVASCMWWLVCIWFQWLQRRRSCQTGTQSLCVVHHVDPCRGRAETALQLCWLLKNVPCSSWSGLKVSVATCSDIVHLMFGSESEAPLHCDLRPLFFPSLFLLL